MKKLLLTIALILIATNVFAAWEFLATTSNGEHFYDKSSIKRNGSIVRVWTYVNYNQANVENNEQSMVGLKEFDCKNETNLVLSLDAYSEVNLKGTMTSVNAEKAKKQFVRPNTIDSQLMKLACKNN